MPKSKKEQYHKRKLRIIDENAPFPFVEAYKSLRTNVDFLASDNNYHTILITSAGPWDGKSTVAINLAIAMADSGKKVVLVDGDLRKGSIARYLKIGRGTDGITSVLSGRKELQSVILHIENLGFDVLTVGSLPTNPAEIVGSNKMIKIIQQLSELYDYVFIDSPPVSVVTDAAVLSRYVDGVILVVRADETTKQEVYTSKQALEDVNANILGAVLNAYDMKKHSYGGGYYSYRYEYGGYGRRPDKKGTKNKTGEKK